jgi:hypothetical protein
MLEPYALKGACPVLRRGKFERTYLFQIDTQIPLSVNDEWWLLIKIIIGDDVNTLTIPPCEYDCKVENKKISRSRSKRSEACYLIR